MKNLLQRCGAFALLLIFLLSGCRAPFSLPRAKEPRGLNLVSVLAAGQGMDGSVRIMAASQARGGQVALFYESKGPSLSGAVLSSRDQGTQTVSYAHVEQLLIDERFAETRLSELFSFCFQNGEQSVESNLWLLRDAPIDSVFGEGEDPAGRLSTLRSSGKAATSLPPRTLHFLAAKWAEDESLLVPALRLVEGELVFDSYALIKEGQIVGYIEGDIALGCVLLAGDPLHWSETFTMKNGERVTVQFFAKGSKVRPVLQDKELKSLNIRISLRGTVTEGWPQGQLDALSAEAERRIHRQLEAAMVFLRGKDADVVNLQRKAGLSIPWRWETIQEQWEERFSLLPFAIELSLRLKEGL